MQKQKLIINKDNYKGYLILYENKKISSSNEQICCEKSLKNAVIVAIISFIAGIVTLTINPQIFAYFILPGYIIAQSAVFYNSFKKSSNLNEKIMNEVKEKYPYVDTNIELSELEKSLEKAKIITFEHKKNCTIVTYDVKEYENYIKCEEIKEKYLEETKYKGYEITEEQRNNPKIKKLVR